MVALARIDAFLKLGTQQGCSDVHLAVGVPPMLRMHGDLLPIKFRELRAGELEGYITEILTRSQTDVLAKGNDLDFSYVSSEGGRFRVNVFRKETGMGATFRSIPQDVKIAVAARDCGRCRQCGSSEELHFDHVIAWSKGGSNTIANIQLLCGACNRRKGADDIPATL